MLTKRALQFYFDKFQGKRASVEELFEAIRDRFMTKEHIRLLLREWESITLSYVMGTYNDGKATECFEILIGGLQDIRSGLTKEYKKKLILQNKLLNALKDV